MLRVAASRSVDSSSDFAVARFFSRFRLGSAAGAPTNVSTPIGERLWGFKLAPPRVERDHFERLTGEKVGVQCFGDCVSRFNLDILGLVRTDVTRPATIEL
jgi:hypothetical protein